MDIVNKNNKNNINNNNNIFSLDELLDFPEEDDVMTDVFVDSFTCGGNSGDSSSLTVVDSCNSCVSGADTQFSGTELCVPVRAVNHGGDGEFETRTMDIVNKNKNNNINNNNIFVLDDLLDLPEVDDVMTDVFVDSFTCGGNSGNSSSLTVPGTELCVPNDDLAELDQWLGNLVEESFSSDELQNLQIISPTTNSKTAPVAAAAITDTSSSATTNTTIANRRNISSHIFSSDVSVPGKARSKRSRAAPRDWSSRLRLLSPPNSSSDNNTTVPDHHPLSGRPKTPKSTPSKKREARQTPGRKCLHCASEKTPQWRIGPMGPKTLCNACGVHYSRTGLLVPEYRPAASPTFVSARHSNSHRKVLELRRQKKTPPTATVALNFLRMQRGDEFLIHRHQFEASLWLRYGDQLLVSFI